MIDDVYEKLFNQATVRFNYWAKYVAHIRFREFGFAYYLAPEKLEEFICKEIVTFLDDKQQSNDCKLNLLLLVIIKDHDVPRRCYFNVIKQMKRSNLTDSQRDKLALIKQEGK